MYRDHRKGPGGPSGGATYPGGPRGLKVEGNQPLVGWGAPLGPPPMRLGLGTLGWGDFPLALGGKATPSPPLAAAPPTLDGFWPAPPPKGGYIKGGRRAATYSLGRLPPPLQHLSLSRRSSAKPCRRPATSITTPSCCWISINLSSPLAGSRRRRRRCTVRVLNAEVPSVRHSVIGDLDHGEYDSVIHVHWNASARDLQGYVDALPSPRC